MKLVQTCAACPEQYELRTQQDTVIGRLKLRHGRFLAWHGDQLVHMGLFDPGTGVFTGEERAEHLPFGVAALLRAEGAVPARDIPGLATILVAACIPIDPGDDF